MEYGLSSLSVIFWASNMWYVAHSLPIAPFDHVLGKRGIHAPGTLNFNMFSGGWLPLFRALAQNMADWKIPYTKLTWSETSVCTYSVHDSSELYTHPRSQDFFVGGWELDTTLIQLFSSS